MGRVKCMTTNMFFVIFFDSYWKYAQFNLELLSISTQKFILMIEKYQMYFETPTQQHIRRLLLVKKVSEYEKYFF